jgi:hypothetical protein
MFCLIVLRKDANCSEVTGVRRGTYFGNRRALQNIEGVMRALRPSACRLGGLRPPRERSGRRETRPERGCGNDAENSVKGRRFLPPSHG